jgi:hypothetical protein
MKSIGREKTEQTRDLAEPGANLVGERDGRSYLVDEAVEQEAGAEEGDGEEEHDASRVRAMDRHRPRPPSNPRRRHRHHAQQPRGDATGDGRHQSAPSPAHADNVKGRVASAGLAWGGTGGKRDFYRLCRWREED